MFRKKIDSKHREELKQKAAERIAAAVQRIQKGFAAYMNKKAAVVPRAKMKVLVGVFVIICTGYSVYLVLDAMLRSNSSPAPVTITSIEAPQLQRAPVENSRQGQKHMPGKDAYRKQYLEALRRAGGKRFYDSIMQVHPGLLDSVEYREQFFSNNKN